jgi:hypothetical protein
MQVGLGAPANGPEIVLAQRNLEPFAVDIDGHATMLATPRCA